MVETEQFKKQRVIFLSDIDNKVKKHNISGFHPDKSNIPKPFKNYVQQIYLADNYLSSL
jgi:hypothetical protein